jgi:deazaflavin-dependent oxidoreductase (nitroreductase family)
MDIKPLLPQLTREEYCYLTTTGRVTGKPHQIEIWFGLEDQSLYLLSGGMDKSDWVRNLLKNPSVTVRVGKHNFHARARVLTDEKEENMARCMLAEKYQEWDKGKELSEWARTALPIALDLIEWNSTPIQSKRRSHLCASHGRHELVDTNTRKSKTLFRKYPKRQSCYAIQIVNSHPDTNLET